MSSVHLLQAPAIVLDEASAPPCIKSFCESLVVKLFQYLAHFARTSHDQPRKEMMSHFRDTQRHPDGELLCVVKPLGGNLSSCPEMTTGVSMSWRFPQVLCASTCSKTRRVRFITSTWPVPVPLAHMHTCTHA